MQSYNPAIPGYTFWMVARHVNKKNAGKPRFFVINALLHSHAALASEEKIFAVRMFLT